MSNIDNCNNNYILYQKVFNNVYISKLIFEKVSEINQDLIKNNDNYIKHRNIYKLYEIPIDIIVKYELIAIFQDIIKSKQQYSFKLLSTHKQYLFSNFIKFIEKFRLINEFKEFYLINKNQFLNLNEHISTIKEFYIHSRIDFFQILIESNHCPIEILHFIYQDQKKFIDSEKEYYYATKNDRSEDVNLDLPNYQSKDRTDIIPFQSPFSIYFNKEMIKNVIISSRSIETIKFLDEVLEFDFKFYSKDIFYWAYTGNFIIKNEIINYFMGGKFEFRVPENLYDNNFVENMLKLKYRTFKKKINNGWSIKFNYYDDIFRSVNKIALSNVFKLDYFLILFHSFYFKTQNLGLIALIKIIKLLMKYDQNQIKENEVTSDKIKKIINKISKYNQFQTSFFSPIKKLFIFNDLKNIKINYTNFQFEREVKRIYLFEFLKTISNSNYDDNGFFYFIDLFKFAVQYNEYQLLYQDMQTFKQYIILEKKGSKNLKDIKTLVKQIIFSKKDYQLYQFFYCDLGVFNLYFEHEAEKSLFIFCYFKSEYFNMEQFDGSIQLLKCFKDNNDQLFKPLLTIILNIQDLKYSNVDQIMEILKSYYLKNGDQISIYANAYDLEIGLTNNIDILLYIYKNYNHLFIKWEKCSKINN